MEQTKNSNTAAGGFDLNGLLSSPGLGELIKHLLSAGGAALFNYLMSIKPMQEKIETLTKENKELKERVEQVEDNQEELIRQLKKIFSEKEVDELNGEDKEYFSVKRKDKTLAGKKRKYLD